MAYVYPNCVTVVLWEGGRVRLNPDQKWPADDPFVKAKSELFTDNPANIAHSAGYTPERATAAPGETRKVRRPRQSKAQEAAETEDGEE